MRKLNVGRLLTFAVLLWGMTAESASAELLRWGGSALSLEGGSFELSYQRRLFQPMEDEEICHRCKHYVDLRVGTDDEEIDGIDFDIDTLIAAYRYYFFVDMENEDWAAYLSAGLGRYELDPGEIYSGFNYRIGADFTVTRACRDEKLRSVFLDWEINATHHSIAVPGSNLEYWSYHTGPRFVFLNDGDRDRADLLCACKKGEAAKKKCRADNLDARRTEQEERLVMKSANPSKG